MARPTPQVVEGVSPLSDSNVHLIGVAKANEMDIEANGIKCGCGKDKADEMKNGAIQ